MKEGFFRSALIIAALLTTSQAQAQEYSFRDLGAGQSISINNADHIVGVNGAVQAVEWRAGEPRTLGTLGGTSYAIAINNVGQIVGGSGGLPVNNSEGKVVPLFNGLPVIWNGEKPTQLSLPPNTNLNTNMVIVTGISNAGQVIGYNQFTNPASGRSNSQAVLWNGLMPTLLGVSNSGNMNVPTAINSSGQIVGYAQTIDPYFGLITQQALIWNGGTPSNLGSVGSQAFGINDRGQVVGVNGNYQAVLWSGGSETVLDAPGSSSSQANAINAFGKIVGFAVQSSTGNLQAMLWRDGQAINLNAFLTPRELNDGWVLTEASSINDRGVIVGIAYNSHTKVYDGFELNPTLP